MNPINGNCSNTSLANHQTTPFRDTKQVSNVPPNVTPQSNTLDETTNQPIIDNEYQKINIDLKDIKLESSIITQSINVRLPIKKAIGFDSINFRYNSEFYLQHEDRNKINKDLTTFEQFITPDIAPKKRKLSVASDQSSKKCKQSSTNVQSSKKSKMYLQYLLPLITLHEQVKTIDYQKIDNFLMPIWKFNQFTAKGLLNKSVMEEYVGCIKNDGKASDELLDEIMTQLCEKKPKSLELDRLNGLYQENKNHNYLIKLRKQIKENIQEMYKTYHLGFIEEQDVEESTSTEDQSDKDCDSPATYIKYRALFEEFLTACCEEKDSDELTHRVNSGGCKLMVQGISEILGIGNPDNCIDKLNLKKPDSQNDSDFQNDSNFRDYLKKTVKDLLHLQGEANIHFNDAISLYKEVASGEINVDDLGNKHFYNIDDSKDNNKNIEGAANEWFLERISSYNKNLHQYSFLITKLFLKIKKRCKNDNQTKDFLRYIKLISSAIVGVPIWSCNLTHRYSLLEELDKDIQISDIADVIKSLKDAPTIDYIKEGSFKRKRSMSSSDLFVGGIDSDSQNVRRRRGSHSNHELLDGIDFLNDFSAMNEHDFYTDIDFLKDEFI